MTSLLPTEIPPSVPAYAAEHAEHWQRLAQERRFRIEQLAALDAEVPATPRHADVQRVLHASATAALSEIDAALARMAAGRYGVCDVCEQRISAERLDVIPMASLCMACHYNQQNCYVASVTAGFTHV